MELVNLRFPKKLLLIVNPVSGKRAVVRYLTQIIRCFMDRGYLVTAMVTSCHGEATELVRRYAADFDLVVCSGGDGTLNETLSGLAAEGLHIPLGYIPCGSTNDFALSRHLSSDILAAAKNIADGKLTRYDVGRLGDHYFSYVAAFGAFSWLSYTTDQNLKNVLGHTAYILDGIKDLSKIRPLHVRLEADGTAYEDDYLFGAVANSTSIAGTIQLPETLVDTCDGKFEVLLVKVPRTLMELQEAVVGLLTQDYSAPQLSLFQAEEIRVICPGGIEWTVDGEFSGVVEDAFISVMPGFLQLQS